MPSQDFIQVEVVFSLGRFYTVNYTKMMFLRYSELYLIVPHVYIELLIASLH